jgi:hypothetical protein
VLALVDARAAARGESRASSIRELLTEALEAGRDDGVDRAQIRRMRAMTPGDRIRHMAQVANAQARLRGRARRARR